MKKGRQEKPKKRSKADRKNEDRKDEYEEQT